MQTRRDGNFAAPHIEFQQFVPRDATVNFEGMHFRRGYAKVLQEPANGPFVNQCSRSLWISNALCYIGVASGIPHE
jgi:hypothetical protein